jgi:anti-sigma regulatory factor (Ser/Thr protein kinase)
MAVHWDRLLGMNPTGKQAAPGSCNFSTRFDARLDAVPAAQAFVAQALRRCGVAQDLVHRSEMILEELMRNAILHGYRGLPLQSVWVGVAADGPGQASFWFEDSAPAFDPLAAGAALDEPDMAGPIEKLAVGGVGLVLIRRLAPKVAYSYEAGRNRVAVCW